MLNETACCPCRSPMVARPSLSYIQLYRGSRLAALAAPTHAPSLVAGAIIQRRVSPCAVSIIWVSGRGQLRRTVQHAELSACHVRVKALTPIAHMVVRSFAHSYVAFEHAALAV